MIGHTQPRRLAARTVASRIAEELGVEVGGAVGYAVRFTDRVGDATLVKLMTDGILLNEMQRDRMLLAYDTIIIDEAHERSLNIDFILGYLAQLLPRRPDLKVIVTSATIETERFSAHFGGAPVIEVSGRTFPVEMRYRPLDEQDGDQIAGITDAVRELRRAGPGDVLVFLSGEREIRDTADALPGPRPARHRGAPALRPPLHRRAAAGVPAPPGAAGRAGHQRGRDVDHRARHPLRGRPRHRPHLPLQPTVEGATTSRSSRSRRRRPTSGPAGAGAWPRASASGSTTRTTSTPDPSTPTPRSCAPTWRRSSSR